MNTRTTWLVALTSLLVSTAALASEENRFPEVLSECQDEQVDDRMPIWTWDPSSEETAPRITGDVVYTTVVRPREGETCGTEAWDIDLADGPHPLHGGLVIQLEGSVETVGNTCRREGLFHAQALPGMHQGWVVTRLSAVSPEAVRGTGRYCWANERFR